jgi:ribose transport system substrate-binding protein
VLTRQVKKAFCSVLLVGLVAAAAIGATSSSATPKKQPTIAWIPPVVLPFETAMRAGIKIQAKARGLNVIVAGGEYNVNAQITALNSVLQRKVDAILIWPLDERALAPAFAKVKAAKIPLIVIDAPSSRAFSTVNFQSNDFPVAEQIAEYAAKRVGKPCNVGIMQGIPVVAILNERNKGLASGARKAGCKILEQQVDKTDSPAGAKVISDAWKTKYGSKMNLVLTYADNVALGVVASVGGDFQPYITGFNGDTINIRQMGKGSKFIATGALLSPEIGNGMAYAASQLLDGKRVPSTVTAPYKIVTTENVSSYPPYEARLKAPLKVRFVKQGDAFVLKTTLG